jgi:hypothetical protein
MLPVTCTHESYKRFVVEQLQKHYTGDTLRLLSADWVLIEKLWLIDLSATATFLKEQYSTFGPKPTDPACMLRAYLLMLFTQQGYSITAWVDELRRIPLYAIICGFEPRKTPGIGTFYDFFPRLWDANTVNITSHEKRKRQKPKKGKTKGEKAPTTSKNKVNRLVQRLLRNKGATDPSKQPFDRLFELFQANFLSVSMEMGLLGQKNSMSIAGDGTPVVTSSLPRSKSLCNCRAQGLDDCHHKRYYSQPDCNCGWDSSRERFYNGYHLYLLTASDSPHDLPVFPLLQPASRHDSLSLIVSSIEFHQRFSLGTVSRIILDAAHDVMGIYHLFTSHGIEPVIDLNVRSSKTIALSDGFSLSPKGIPLCPRQIPMRPNGFDQAKGCQKWRCGSTKGTVNSCPNPCSSAKYGRTFLTFIGDNPRLITETRRESPEWKLVYNRRTTAERTNKRQKVDYKLEAGRHRSTMMWYMRVFGIMMCQHTDAWHAHTKDFLQLKNSLLSVA